MAAAKLNCRCLHNQEDELFASWIAAGRDYVQAATRRQIMPATWKLTLGSFPWAIPDAGIAENMAWHEGEDEIDFPITPVRSISSVQYYDEDNVLQTWASDEWELVSDDAAAVLVPAAEAVWPATYDRTDAVQITFSAGYPDNQVPPKMLDAIQLFVLMKYQRRTNSDLIEAVDTLLDLDTTRRYS